MTPEVALLQNYLVVAALLFAIGLVGLLVRRNVIVMFLCVEMMLQGVSLTAVAWGRFHDDWGGQMLVVFVIAVAACEAAIALALVLMLFQRSGTLDVAFWQQLREEGVRPYRDRRVPEVPVEQQAWPRLTPAGVEPPVDEEERRHRSRV